MIAFSYDVSNAIGQVRLYAGDTDASGLNRVGGDRTRTDDEIALLLAQQDNNPRIAAAALLESKAAEFASLASDITQGGLRQDFRQRSQRLFEAAIALRAVTATSALPVWTPPTRDAPFTAGDGGMMENW